MIQKLPTQKRSETEIFANYGWWEPDSLLLRITKERCDYIEACVNRVFGREALQQQEILEVGCGGGLICEELVRRGVVATGIDPSDGALQTARQHVQASGLGHNAYFLRGYAEALPFANGSFSAIVCLDVLEHVKDLRATLREISRVLTPGGLFVFDTINRTLLARLVLIWIGERFFRKYGLVPGLHNHQHFVRPSELQAKLITCGLQIQELTGFTPHLKQGRLTLAPGGPKAVSYVGYAIKTRE